MAEVKSYKGALSRSLLSNVKIYVSEQGEASYVAFKGQTASNFSHDHYSAQESKIKHHEYIEKAL
jgi:hypothetical protein